MVKRFEIERRIISETASSQYFEAVGLFRAETGELVIVIEFVAGETLEEAILGRATSRRNQNALFCARYSRGFRLLRMLRHRSPRSKAQQYYVGANW